MNESTLLKIVGQNAQGHFTFLPQTLGFKVYPWAGVSITYAGLGTSLFNIAYGSPADGAGDSLKSIIHQVKDAFEGQPFAWWLPPGQQRPELTEALREEGFVVESLEQALVCDLRECPPPLPQTDLRIQPVNTAILRDDFIRVLVPYDASARPFYSRMGREYFNLAERLFVGYAGEEPVTIGVIYLREQSAGIFSLLTRPSYQGKGYGTDRMRYLLNFACRKGCLCVSLSASSAQGYRIYERLGFKQVGAFECFEWTGVRGQAGEG